MEVQLHVLYDLTNQQYMWSSTKTYQHDDNRKDIFFYLVWDAFQGEHLCQPANMIFTSKDEIHDDYSTYMMIMAKYIKRNIFSAAPPGAGAAGAAGAALAGLLAGLVPGEKLAMGCWMLVAQAARTGFPNCIVPRFQIGVGSFVWNTQKSHGCRTRMPYSLYKGQTMFFGQPHFYLFPNFHYSLLKSLMIKSLQNSLS